MRKPGMRSAAAAVVATGALLAGTAVAPSVAVAGSGVRTITVTMTAKSVKFSTGTTLTAGRAIFKVVTPKGSHALQLLKLQAGYPPNQANHDVNAAFGGDLKAIHRVDTKILWLGGAPATPGHPGRFVETLYAGTIYATDQNGNAFSKIQVVGTPGAAGWVANSSVITVVKPNRFRTTSTLPRSGYTLFRNHAAEPHMLVFQQVKRSTTHKDVSDYIKSGGHGNPPWALQATTEASVISPGTQILFRYHLPAGKYVLACFWPDKSSGMPHFFMGMWKLVTLK
jgi:hypothetical protein